jgi:hypothetical protein
MAGFDTIDPGLSLRPNQSISTLRCSHLRAAAQERTRYGREMPARELDEENPVLEGNALHRRTGTLGQVRVKS